MRLEPRKGQPVRAEGGPPRTGGALPPLQTGKELGPCTGQGFGGAAASLVLGKLWQNSGRRFQRRRKRVSAESCRDAGLGSALHTRSGRAGAGAEGRLWLRWKQTVRPSRPRVPSDPATGVPGDTQAFALLTRQSGRSLLVPGGPGWGSRGQRWAGHWHSQMVSLLEGAPSPLCAQRQDARPLVNELTS